MAPTSTDSFSQATNFKKKKILSLEILQGFCLFLAEAPTHHPALFFESSQFGAKDLKLPFDLPLASSTHSPRCIVTQLAGGLPLSQFLFKEMSFGLSCLLHWLQLLSPGRLCCDLVRTLPTLLPAPPF